MKKILGLCALILAVGFAVFPETALGAAREALSLCAHTLVPSLFPFFVCANIIISAGLTEKAGQLFSGATGKLFRVNGEGAAAIVLGFLSGYPAGAAVSSRLYEEGRITKSEAERLLAFTNNAGPLFILGTVGTCVYQNPGAGVVLYLSVILASLLTGLLMRFYGKESMATAKKKRSTDRDPMGDAVNTVFSLCGYVVFFAVLIAFAKKIGLISFLCMLFQNLGLSPETASLLSLGMFEISTAAQRAPGALPAMAALLSFGGLSVLLQTMSITRRARLSIKPYLLGKTISSLLSAVLCYGILKGFPIAVRTGVFMQKTVLYTEYLAAAVLMAIGVYLLYRLLSRIYS